MRNDIFERTRDSSLTSRLRRRLPEAEAFLEDCMAVVVESLDEVREYFEENGTDVDWHVFRRAGRGF